MKQQLLPLETPSAATLQTVSGEVAQAFEPDNTSPTNPDLYFEEDEEQSLTEARTKTSEVADTLVNSQALAALLAAAQRKIRRRRIKFWGALAFVEIINLLQVPFRWLLSDQHMSLLIAMLIFASMLVGVVFMFTVMFKRAEFGVEELAQAGGVRAIPTLLDSLNSGMASGIRKTIYRALAILLPQLKATDANLLTLRHRRLLNNALRFETWLGSGLYLSQQVPEEFILAVLKAYEQVGDAKAVPAVERLANRKARSGRRLRIKEAAQACLPLLQSNTGAVGQTQTLLRAADKTSSPDILLRPVSETATSSDPAQLLRAAPSHSDTQIS